MPQISVVVPIFREEAIVGELVERLRTTLQQLTADFEVLLVDDGSDDRTWEAVLLAAEQDKRIKGLRFTRNFGQHHAISAGLEACDGDWVVVMDGDLQDRPEMIPRLYEAALSGFDVVFVSRQNRPESAIYRFVQHCFYRSLSYLAKTDYDPSLGNFSIISRRVVDSFRRLPEAIRFYGGSVYWLGFRRTAVPADHGSRHSGQSTYSLRKRARLATDIILAHSDRPLRLSVGLGLTMSAAAFLYAIVVVIRALTTGYAVLGWPSLIVALFFTSGMILTVLGIVGLYIGRIFDEVKRRPLYVLQDRVGI